MSPEQKEEAIKIALGILRYDDAHPDVGWGMPYFVAVDNAIKKMHHLAKLFGHKLSVTEEEKEEISKVVLDVRCPNHRNFY